MAQSLNYTIKIPWSDVLSELIRMSSYEGRFAVTPSGESNYINVHITDQDEALIYQQIPQATYVVQDKLGNLVSSMTYNAAPTKTTTTTTEESEEEEQENTTFVFTVDSARTSCSELGKMMTEAIATYVMAQWLSERKHERYDFFANLHEQMISGIKKSLTRKTAPVLTTTE